MIGCDVITQNHFLVLNEGEEELNRLVPYCYGPKSFSPDLKAETQ